MGVTWTASREEVPGGFRFVAEFDVRPATVADVLHALQSDAAFRAWFNTLLAEMPFSAFRVETPGATTATLTRPFEFVALDDPDLIRPPDPIAFAEHFRAVPDAQAIEFANLRGDAILIVPTPLASASASAYGHLAAFVRESPEAQRDALWKLVGDATAHRVGAKPVWLSTAGAGVSWLHVRLDDRPKYYGHEPYRRKSE